MNAIAQLDSQVSEAAQQYLIFMLSLETYAINIVRIKEIIQCSQLTEVPRMPAFIRGVINLRGSVVPVIDLSARFGKKSAELSRRNCIIIIETEDEDGHQHIGMMVDAVSAVLEIPDNEIEPAPTFGTDIHTDFIAGMAKVNDKFVIVLNILRVLSMNDMESLISLGNASPPLSNELASLGPK
ncbi:MAG: chemotaxis protein CheW [Methylobacter sp.]